MPLVLVTGLPGSGKSTLAASLASRLDLPVIAKDRFKEILFDTLGSGDVAWSRRLGRAAVALQYDANADREGRGRGLGALDRELGA